MNRYQLSAAALMFVAATLTSPVVASAQAILLPTADEIAAAMDIPTADIVPGSVQLVSAPDPRARTVAAAWGTGGLGPRAGVSLAVFSTGTARTPSMPGYVVPDGGTQWLSTTIPLPFTPPDVPGCSGSSQTYDVTEFQVQLVVPAGANGFSFEHNFLAIDYPEYVCTSYNDGFVALVDSPTAGANVNVALDSMNNPTTLNAAFWQAGAPSGGFTPPMGVAPLQGTGYETGGATMWNTASVPATPGETVTLRLFLYDAGDAREDSEVLLDNFQWLHAATEPPSANAGPDQTVSTLSGSANVTLSGSGSDPEGGTVTFAWAWAGGSASGPAPTITLPLGVHVVTLTVSDPNGGAGTDSVTITVADGTPGLTATISGLLESDASQDATIAALQATVTGLLGSIADLQSNISMLLQTVTAQGTRLEGAESRAAALEAQVLQLQTMLQGILKHPIWNSVPNAGGRR